jgi:hypothetical protein
VVDPVPINGLTRLAGFLTRAVSEPTVGIVNEGEANFVESQLSKKTATNPTSAHMTTTPSTPSPGIFLDIFTSVHLGGGIGSRLTLTTHQNVVG